MRPVVFRVRWWLRTHLGSVAGLALLVAIVGGMVLALAGGAARTLSAPDRYSSARGHEWDVSLQQEEGLPRLADLESLPSVRRVGLMTFVFGGLLPANGDEPIDALVFAGSTDAVAGRLVAGTFADPLAPGQFVANEMLVREAGLHLGDQLTLLTFTAEQGRQGGFDSGAPEGPTLPAELVGVIEDSLEDDDATGIAVFPASLLDQGDIGVSASVGLLATTPGTTPERLRAQMDALPDGRVFSISPAELVPAALRRAVNAQGQGLAVVAVIVGVASVAVLAQLLQRRLRLSPSERWALNATGLTRAQLIGEPVARATVSVLVGAVGAAAIAVLASGIFPIGFADRVEPDPGIRFDPAVHLFGAVVLAVVVLAWVAVAFALQNRRRRPVRVEGRALPSRPTRVAVGSRFAFTRAASEGGSPLGPLVGVVAVLAVCIGALTFGASLRKVLDDPARFGLPFDVGVGQGGEIPQEAADALAADPDIAAVWLYSNHRVAVGAAALDVTGMQPLKGDLSPHVFVGRLPVGPSEIALGRVAARQLGVSVGDDLQITGSEGFVIKTVIGIVVVPGIEGNDGVGEGGVVTFEGLLTLDPTAVPSAAGLDLRPGAPKDTTQRLSEQTGLTVGGTFSRPPAIISLARVRSLPTTVAVVLLALAALSLLHQLVLSVQRRRRDVAVLRAIGADQGWVRSTRHWQASVFAIVAAIVAIPLGIIAGGVVFRAFIERVGAQDDVAVPLAGIAIVAALLIVLANLTVIVAARRADRRLTPAAALARE